MLEKSRAGRGIKGEDVDEAIRVAVGEVVVDVRVLLRGCDGWKTILLAVAMFSLANIPRPGSSSLPSPTAGRGGSVGSGDKIGYSRGDLGDRRTARMPLNVTRE